MINMLEKARLSQIVALRQIIFSSQTRSKKAKFLKFGLEKVKLATLVLRRDSSAQLSLPNTFIGLSERDWALLHN